MPLLILIAGQMFVYFVVVSLSLVFLQLSKGSMRFQPYRKGVLVGICASPVGFVAPYVLFGLLVLLCHGTWPVNGIPVIDAIARVFVVCLPILGPCAGPIVVVLGVAIFHPRTENA